MVGLEVRVTLVVALAFMEDSSPADSSLGGTEEQERVVSTYCSCRKGRMVLVGILDALLVVVAAVGARADFLAEVTVEEVSVSGIVLGTTMPGSVDYETVGGEDLGSRESPTSYLVAVQILKVRRTIEKLDRSLVASEDSRVVVRMVMYTTLEALLLVRILP